MVDIRPVKVLRPPRAEIENSAHTKRSHVKKTETENGLDLRPYRKIHVNRPLMSGFLLTYESEMTSQESP